jgi:hypothetical protein
MRAMRSAKRRKNEEWSMVTGDGGGQSKAGRSYIVIALRARTKE